MSSKIILIIPILLACSSLALAIWNLVDLHKAKQRRMKELNKYTNSLSETDTDPSGDDDCKD